MANYFDMSRLFGVYLLCYEIIRDDPEFILPYQVRPTVFLLMWHKVINYLKVFKATRYIIQMIGEILMDIMSFLLILFTSMFAYSQINYVLSSEKNFDGDIKAGYTLSLGDTPDLDDYPLYNFFIFMIFSFLIPMVLMNMMIALMGDSYTRVQNNAIAADTRALCVMQLDLDEFIHLIKKIKRSPQVNATYYYCFHTSINDADKAEDWEGTVG